jgi:hypothetical protein
MNGFLVYSTSGMLGLAFVGETRKIENVVYDSLARNLLITYDDGETEHMDDKVDVEFNGALLAYRYIQIGHFPDNKFEQGPSEEYQVPLRQ